MEPEQPWADLYREVGECIHAWSGVETNLTTLFVTLHDREPFDLDDLLRASFESVISLEVRLAMLLATVNADPRCKEYREPFSALKNKVMRSYKQRHEIAHFTLVGSGMRSPGNPGYALQPFFTMSSFLTRTGRDSLKIGELKRRALAFHDLATRVHLHALYIRQTRGLPVSDQARIDDPALLLQSLSGH